jgi:hypothetical protein
MPHPPGYLQLQKGRFSAHLAPLSSLCNSKKMETMKRGRQRREKKSLSISELLNIVRGIFNKIKSPVQSRKISLSDCLMSALAMFNLKSPSLLAFDQGMIEPNVEENLKTLFKIRNVPCDTHMREILDEIDFKELRECYLSVFHEAQRGKLLEHYEYLGGYLCLVDGTEIFNSEKVHCKNCCQKKHQNGRVSYHHQILGAVIAKPGVSQVIPLCPEPIKRQDGTTKNDCERNAFARLIEDLKHEHPKLKLTICSDALSANAPHVNCLKSFGYNYIIVVKPEGNKTLFDWVKNIKQEKSFIIGKNKYTFRYVNKVPLNDTKNAPEVNFLECEWIEVIGKQEKKGCCAWITDHEITEKNLYELMCGGRTRWKVENETFNTLKNQGYQFEHNFGHGKKNLHTVFAFLMMLAFLIDQIQEAACGLFQEALKSMKSRRAFWERMRNFFYMYLIDSWVDLFEAMKQRATFRGERLNPNTS